MLAVLERPVRAERPAAVESTSRLPIGERLIGLWAIGLLTLFSMSAYAVFWAPKAALLLVMVVPGAVALFDAARRGVAGARWAAAFLTAAGISTLLADRVWLSLLGTHNWGTGWLFVLALAGVWSMGTRVSERGAAWIERAIVGAALANAVWAGIQTTVRLPWDILDAEGRASGLLGNPVHLGALAAGALWIASARLAPRATPWRLGVVALLAATVQLSGSRSGLIPLVVVAAVWGWRLRYRRAFALALAVTIGLAGGAALGRLGGDGAVGATERAAVSLSPGGPSGRAAVWAAAPDALADRPLLGWGPGRFQTGVSPHAGSEVARFEQGGAEYRDGHNIVVEYGVTTGLVGLVLLGLWLVSTGRRARGALAGFAGVVALVGMTQPQSVAITPVAALALGVAARGPTPPLGRRARAVVTTGVALGGIVAAVFLAGEVSLARGALDFSERDVTTARRLLAPWPEVSRVGWRVAAFEGISADDEDAWARALERAREAVTRDPADSGAWADLGDLSLRRGDTAQAETSYRAAVERYPWSVRGLRGVVFFADRRGDEASVAELCERLAVVRPENECLAEVRRAFGTGGAEQVGLLP